jgi:hypothetical protein
MATERLQQAAGPGFASFSPELRPDDPVCGYWLEQVTLRLRREVAWIWHERGLGAQPRPDAVPPVTDAALESLDLSRYHELKQRFFDSDETGRFLSERIAASPPALPQAPPRGSFGWAVAALDLDDASAFVLALALSPAYDSACGSVIGACLNLARPALPDLALAQRLWDAPEAALALLDPAHPLYRFGLLHRDRAEGAAGVAVDWRQPLLVPARVARLLVDSAAPLAADLRPVAPAPSGDGGCFAEAVAGGGRLASSQATELRLVPVLGPHGADFEGAVAAAARAADRPAVAYTGPSELLASPHAIAEIATACWLRGADLFFDRDATAVIADPRAPRAAPLSQIEGLPLCLYLAANGRAELAGLKQRFRLPEIEIEPLGFEERRRLWSEQLAPASKELRRAIEDCAHRFRFEPTTIASVCRSVAGRRPSADELRSACRAALALDLGELAEPIRPRFSIDELVLPQAQGLQIEEIARAMASIARVHHEWGTERAWDGAGLSVLFTGPPGTGKTMAAEVLANELELPLYRIDLSQVVNKYIGETEKNLKRLFDAADQADLILFFDEADALFGKRTQVRDAHDRYANLEISYLLSRMEKAKGLTILASNRKDDLDEAFFRRLRYIVNFPIPSAEDRRRIWRLCIPEEVDAEEVDLDFLADSFPLSGGHIRSAAFNAMLQSAARGNGRARRLRHPDVLVAVWRELRKADRSVGPDSFGRYAALVRELETPGGQQ